MKTKQIFLQVLSFLVPITICGILGLFIGMTAGGSFGAATGAGCVNVRGTMMCDEGDEGFVYLDQAGWEAGGLLGLHLGALFGLGAGIYIWKTRFKKNEQNREDI